MKKNIIKIWVVIYLLTLASTAFAAQKVKVFVSISPQKFFVQQIGKDLVDVNVMVQPGQSPATYEPKPKQMVAISKSKLYFAIGVPFEDTWLKKISTTNPNMNIIHTDNDIQKIKMAEGYHHKQRHSDHLHDDTGLDPHIWLSPKLVQIQALAILNALKKVDPLHQKTYQNNYQMFVTQVKHLDARLSKLFYNKNKLRFLVFHPSWGYFAKDYGLEQIAIEIEGKNPKPADIKEIINYARENKIKIIFAQPQFSTKNAKLIAREINGAIVFADPLAFNWILNMDHVAQKFKEALK